ncbi:hypothetical protein [Azospirillum argentinense]|uniref:hypothetical protein n=1 Tax=Azospirillum argentinense TaxID=2970906 RepID=UPI0032DF0BC2
MANNQRDVFATEYSAILREEFPDYCIRYTDDQLRFLLLQECDRQKAYSVGSAYGIYTMLTLRLRLGGPFPEGEDHAWAREILARDLVPEADRIAALEEVVWGVEENQP